MCWQTPTPTKAGATTRSSSANRKSASTPERQSSAGANGLAWFAPSDQSRARFPTSNAPHSRPWLGKRPVSWSCAGVTLNYWTSPSRMPSPASPIGHCSSIVWRRRSLIGHGAALKSASCSATSTTSRASTTVSVMRQATGCCATSGTGCAPSHAKGTPWLGSLVTSSCSSVQWTALRSSTRWSTASKRPSNSRQLSPEAVSGHD